MWPRWWCLREHPWQLDELEQRLALWSVRKQLVANTDVWHPGLSNRQTQAKPAACSPLCKFDISEKGHIQVLNTTKIQAEPLPRGLLRNKAEKTWSPLSNVDSYKVHSNNCCTDLFVFKISCQIFRDRTLYDLLKVLIHLKVMITSRAESFISYLTFPVTKPCFEILWSC